MARDTQYDSMFNLEDSGYQGFDSPNESVIRNLIGGPVSVGDFILNNENLLAQGRQSLLASAMEAIKGYSRFKNPKDKDGEENPFTLGLSVLNARQFEDALNKFNFENEPTFEFDYEPEAPSSLGVNIQDIDIKGPEYEGEGDKFNYDKFRAYIK